MQEEYSLYLPSYRSLLSPGLKYDYRSHRAVQLTQQDIKNIIAKFQSVQSQQHMPFNTKYRSLLSDVTFQALRISKKVLSLAITSHEPPKPAPGLRLLPSEIQIIIFTYVDDFDLYRNCLYVCRHFYLMVKPFLLRSVAFDSTFRFAQFVTLLRLNPAAGQHVHLVDLSDLKLGIHDISSLDELLACDTEGEEYTQISAGWRDWKFKNNLHALHPFPVVPPKSHVPPVQNLRKRIKISKYFKRRKSHIPERALPVVRKAQNPSSTEHPKTNKFLISYAFSKDVPVGYILHVINLCPNLKSFNLANLSLSSDYRVISTSRAKYHSYDLMNNYPKDTMEILDQMRPSMHVEASIKSSIFDLASSKSSIFPISTFSKPIWKYNSLLPPVTVSNQLLIDAGDGELFLSDLNLKAINNTHLQIILHHEIFHALQKRLHALTMLNMSSIIWIDIKMVRQFLRAVFSRGLYQKTIEGVNYELYESSDKSQFVMDLRNSGMQRNLPWARLIDSKTREGESLVNRILNDELLPDFEERFIHDQQRRGRVGENYFA